MHVGLPFSAVVLALAVTTKVFAGSKIKHGAARAAPSPPGVALPAGTCADARDGARTSNGCESSALAPAAPVASTGHAQPDASSPAPEVALTDAPAAAASSPPAAPAAPLGAAEAAPEPTLAPRPTEYEVAAAPAAPAFDGVAIRADVSAEVQQTAARAVEQQGAASAQDLAVARLRNQAGLLAACRRGDTAAACRLLQEAPAGLDPNVADEAGWTALHHAALRGDLPAVAALLAAGADPGARNADGASPLRWAVAAGRLEVAAALRAAAAGAAEVEEAQEVRQVGVVAVGPPSVAAAPAQQEAALMAAQPAVVKEQRPASAPDAGMQRQQQQAPPRPAFWPAPARSQEEVALLVAARRGDAGAVKELLTAPGVNPNAADEAGWTALHHAGLRGDLPAVAALLAAGADPGARNADGASPLRWAVAAGRQEVAAALRGAGTEKAMEAQAQEGDTAAGAADALQGTLAVEVPAATAAPAQETAVDVVAAAREQPAAQAAETMRQRRQQQQAPPRPAFWPAPARLQEEVALLGAARCGDAGAVTELLADPGVNPNAADEAGWTALHHAALRGHSAAAQALLAAGADPNARNADGATPLQWAAVGGHVELVALLVRAGAAAGAEAPDGRTAQERARLWGRGGVQRELAGAGAA